MVCTGNICRSPMAEAVLRQRLGDAGIHDVVVDSYGTGPWHVGQNADPRAVETLHAHGYDVAHRAREVTAADLGEHDLMIAMDRSHLDELTYLAGDPAAPPEIRLLSSFAASWPADTLNVPDPYSGGLAGFELVLDLVERGADGVVEFLQARG